MVDAIEKLWRWQTGVDKDLRTDLRLFLREMTGSARVAEMLTTGLGRGSEADVSQRLGMGKLAPRIESSIFDILGVQGHWFKRAVQTYDAVKHGAGIEAVSKAMPLAIADPMQALEWRKTGVRSQASGRKVIHESTVTVAQQATKFLGFTPSAVSLERERAYTGRRRQHSIDDLRRDSYTILARDMVEAGRARDEGDMTEAKAAAGRVTETRRRIAEHNRSAEPHERIIIRPPTLKQALIQERRGLAAARGKGPKQARGAKATIDSYYDELRR